MTLRRIAATAFAALMLTGLAAASASAQPRHHGHSGGHHSAAPHHARMKHQAARPQRMARGGMQQGGTLDRGPTSADRSADQLNAQSLEQARSGQ